MTSDELLKEICAKEIQFGCYNHNINGISVYNFVQRFLRKQKCREYGFISRSIPKQASKKEKMIVLFRSVIQLIILLLFKKETKNFIYSFPRVDRVNGVYLDKFTDPIIDNSNIRAQGYVIFEKGFYYKHSVPRYHKDKVIYCDAVDYIASILSIVRYKKFVKKYNSVFQELWRSIDAVFPNVVYSKEITARTILQSLISTRVYKFIFKRLSVNHLFAPGRGAFSLLIPAAKMNGIKVFELQHGVTYGESVTYSGYRDPLFTPDFFLSFEKNTPLDVYGISPEKIVSIGFAFNNYLERITSSSDNKVSESDVLVVSDPQITTLLLPIILQFAQNNPSVMFYFRPHPEEILTDNQKRLIDSIPNMLLDDNKCNIMVALSRFMHVIGENSTVLYEALAMGKKVAKLNLGGLNPRYIVDEDKVFFYEITNNMTFTDFIKAPVEEKASKKLYADFKPEVLNNLI